MKFSFFFFSKTFHQKFIMEPSREESRIKSNRIRSHWIRKKLFETFSRGAISRTSSENLSSSSYTCLVYAAISRAYGAYFSLLLPRPARGKRGRIERWRKHHAFFLRLAGNQRIFQRHEFNSYVTDIRVSRYTV